MLEPYSVLHNDYQITYTADEQPDSTIYRARDQRTMRRVLIAALPQPDETALHDAQQVTSQVASLRVAGLLTLRDQFTEGLTCYVVIDDPQGQDLDRAAFSYSSGDGIEAQQTFTEAAALQQMERMLYVVETLHAAAPPLFLGEVRSTDIWSAADGNLSLAPFALVRTIGTELSVYCAPELQDIDNEPTVSSDIYALGAVLYRLLTGWFPPTAAQRMAGTPLNPPRLINPDLSPLVEQVVLRALDMQPDNRYQRVQELRQALAIVSLMGDRWPAMVAAEQYSTNAGDHLAAHQPAATLAQPASPTDTGTELATIEGTRDDTLQAAPQRMHPCLVMTISFLGFLSLIICGIGGMLLTEPGQAFVRDILTQGTGAAPARDATPQPPSSEPTRTPEPAVTETMPLTITPGIISSATITQVGGLGVIERQEVGPALYSPDGTLLAVGVGDHIQISSSTPISDSNEVGSTSAMTHTEIVPQPLHLLKGHTGKVTSLAFTQLITETGNGALLLASGSVGDETVRVWDVQSGQLRWQLSGHTGWIRSLAASPDGTLLASGSTDTTIKLWDMQSGDVVQTLSGHSGLLGNIAFSPDGALLASTARDGTVRLWDIASGSEVAADDFPQPFFQSPDDPATGQPYWTTGVDFSPDGSLLAAGSVDGRVRLFDVANGNVVETLRGHSGWVVIRGVAFSPDGATLATTGLDGTVQMWDVATASLRRTLEYASFQVLGLAWHPDSQHISASSGDAGSVWVWNSETGEVTQRLHFGQGMITTLAYSAESRVLGMASVNGVMHLHILDESRHITFTNAISNSQAMEFVDENRLVVATRAVSNNLVLLDLEKRPQQQPQPLQGLEGQALHVTVSPDQTLIAASTVSGTVVLWDVQTQKRLRILDGLSGTISALAFSSDNTYLIASSTRNQGGTTHSHIGVWRVERGNLLHILQGDDVPVTGLAMQPQGSVLASLSAEQVQLWDVETGQPVNSISPDEGDDAEWSSLAFSPDGTLLALGDTSGSISFWNSNNSDSMHQVAIRGSALALAFSPDGKRLAVSLSDGGVGLLGIREDDPR